MGTLIIYKELSLLSLPSQLTLLPRVLGILSAGTTNPKAGILPRKNSGACGGKGEGPRPRPTHLWDRMGPCWSGGWAKGEGAHLELPTGVGS